MGIFRTLVFRKFTNLRRFAAGNSVFDDFIASSCLGDEMPNMPFPVGTTINVRLVTASNCATDRSPQIAYEMWREKGGALDHDLFRSAQA